MMLISKLTEIYVVPIRRERSKTTPDTQHMGSPAMKPLEQMQGKIHFRLNVSSLLGLLAKIKV